MCQGGREGDAVAVTAPRGSQPQLEVDDHYLVALAKQGKRDAYDRIVRRYYGFVRLKASSYFLIGGDSDDLIQEGLVGLYKAVRDYRTDRESSFRNFAELCITRQIITAVKTSTRNKHTPLNQYVSFSQTPAPGGDSDPTPGEALPAPTARRAKSSSERLGVKPLLPAADHRGGPMSRPSVPIIVVGLIGLAAIAAAFASVNRARAKQLRAAPAAASARGAARAPAPTP